ncbi:hypothetical protein STSO111631_06380 [Stackebrandtia soli]
MESRFEVASTSLVLAFLVSVRILATMPPRPEYINVAYVLSMLILGMDSLDFELVRQSVLGVLGFG